MTNLCIAAFGVRTIAGDRWSTNPGPTDGIGTLARFNYPTGLVYNRGTLYVIDFGSAAVRAIKENKWNVSTVVGGNGGGYLDGAGTVAKLNGPFAITIDSASQVIYFTEIVNFVIRRFDLASG